eukprot:642262_1
MSSLSINPWPLPIVGFSDGAVTVTSFSMSAGGNVITVNSGEKIELIDDPGIGTTVTITVTYDWDSTAAANLWCPGCIRQFLFNVEGTDIECVSHGSGTSLSDQTMSVSYVHDASVRHIWLGWGTQTSCVNPWPLPMNRRVGYIHSDAQTIPEVTNVLYIGGYPSVLIHSGGRHWNVQVDIIKDESATEVTSLSCLSQEMTVFSLPVSGVEVFIEIDQNDGTFIVSVDGNQCTDALVNAPVSFDPIDVYKNISIPSSDRILSGEVIQDLVLTLYDAPGPKCTYDLDYFFDGTDCVVSGDPHFRMWNGDRHDFQGQPSTGKDEFYYLHRCAGVDSTMMPFSISGRHHRWSSKSVSGLDYIIIHLVDSNGDMYYVWLSSGIHAYLDAATATNTNYDDNTATASALTSGTEEQIGSRFALLYTQTSTNQIKVVLTIQQTCTVELYMKGEAVYDSATGFDRYRMHYLQITPPECYRCFICGLCGDFANKATYGVWERVQTCNGGFTSYRAGYSAAITEAYDVNGWSWEYSYVEANCNATDAGDGSGTVDPEPYFPAPLADPIVEPCDNAALQRAVIEECQSARDSRTTCCETIGEEYCDTQQDNCEVDACVVADGDLTAISDAVAEIFTEAVDLVCNLPDAGTRFDPTKTEPSPNAPEPE